MRVSLPTALALAALAATQQAAAQTVTLQNDSFTGGSVSCQFGIGNSESIAAKFTALPGQYPYTLKKVQVFGCGAPTFLDGYIVEIWPDNNGTAAPSGPRLWQSTLYVIDGSNVINEIDVETDPTPPPTIASGSIRIALFHVPLQPIGIGTDTNGIVSQVNYTRTAGGTWAFGENDGLTGDWILRLVILPNSPVELQSFQIE